MVSMVRCHKRAHSLLDGVHEGVVLLQQVKIRLYNLLLEEGDVTDELIKKVLDGFQERFIDYTGSDLLDGQVVERDQEHAQVVGQHVYYYTKMEGNA